jgi:hypothetical protein
LVNCANKGFASAGPFLFQRVSPALTPPAAIPTQPFSLNLQQMRSALTRWRDTFEEVAMSIATLVLFILSAAGVGSRINLTAAGLAFLAAAMLVPALA